MISDKLITWFWEKSLLSLEGQPPMIRIWNPPTLAFRFWCQKKSKLPACHINMLFSLIQRFVTHICWMLVQTHARRDHGHSTATTYPVA